jgi:hypothetical protein
MAARFVDELAELFLGMAEVGDQPLIGLGFLDRVEVLALDILDQRDFQRLLVAELADDGRNLVQPRPLRRPPTALAGDDLETVAVGPNDDWLDHAARLDRGGQLRQRLLLEDSPRLAGMGFDAGDGDHLDGAARGIGAGAGADWGFLSNFAEQRGKAAAEAGRTLAGKRLAHAASAFCGRRAINSRASAI